VPRATAVRYGRKQAGEAITSLRAKQCTIKQAQTLRRYGFDPAAFNVDRASAQIQRIADNGWRWP
jgi:hypothetical protein